MERQDHLSPNTDITVMDVQCECGNKEAGEVRKRDDGLVGLGRLTGGTEESRGDGIPGGLEQLRAEDPKAGAGTVQTTETTSLW